MRALKASAHVGFRTLETRAEAAGDVLPRSTLVAVLSRDTLPREEVVAAFVRACGLDDVAVGRWLSVRRLIAQGECPDGPALPLDPPPAGPIAVPDPIASVATPAVTRAAPPTVSPTASPWIVDFVPPAIWRGSWAMRIVAAVLFGLVLLVTLAAVVNSIRDWLLPT